MILLIKLLDLLTTLLKIYQYLIVGYILISFIYVLSGRDRTQNVLYKIVEPYLQVFRNIIPVVGGLDFSPILGYYLIEFAIIGVKNLIVTIN